MKKIKPMKGCTVEDIGVNNLPYPIIVSPKIDGIRALSYDGAANSTTGKKLPNEYIQKFFSEYCGFLQNLDGELIVGNPFDKNLMQATSSGVMSIKGEPEFTYIVFDDFTFPDKPYEERLERASCKVDILNSMFKENDLEQKVKLIYSKEIYDREELYFTMKSYVNMGYEGIVGRKKGSPYKFGRSTPKQQYIFKWKPWSDEEATIVGFNELMNNDNESFLNELGLSKRSSSQENKIPADSLGSFRVYSDIYGKEFNVATGSLTMEKRKSIWKNKHKYLGEILTYKFFNFGIVDVPRQPTFKGFRDKIDLTDY